MEGESVDLAPENSPARGPRPGADAGGAIDGRCGPGNASILNNVITGNSAYQGGGLFGCDGAIRNNTIYGNSADYGGGLWLCEGDIRNCIIWANKGFSDPELCGSSKRSYSCTEGGRGRGR